MSTERYFQEYPFEGNIIEDNRKKIADHFNDYFINVGPKIGTINSSF